MIANGLAFVITFALPELRLTFGLRPADLVEKFAVWQLVTYMFLHGGISHILFNMLTLWMMGVELERRWGTRFFTKFYFTCGIGAGLTQVLLGLLPLEVADHFYLLSTIGASGAIFGLLLAYALYFPHRPILMFFIFPVPAKYFVMILGAIQLLLASSGGGGVAYTAHLGGHRHRVSLSQGYPHQPVLGDPVPLSQVAHQPHTTQVRCVFRRPPRRHRSACPLVVCLSQFTTGRSRLSRPGHRGRGSW